MLPGSRFAIFLHMVCGGLPHRDDRQLVQVLLCEINGGATAIPVEGGLLNDEGKIIPEHPVIVYSFVANPEAFLEHLPRLRAFLHLVGRETNQGEVAFEIDGRFFRIRQLDKAADLAGGAS